MKKVWDRYLRKEARILAYGYAIEKNCCMCEFDGCDYGDIDHVHCCDKRTGLFNHEYKLRTLKREGYLNYLQSSTLILCPLHQEKRYRDKATTREKKTKKSQAGKGKRGEKVVTKRERKKRKRRRNTKEEKAV